MLRPARILMREMHRLRQNAGRRRHGAQQSVDPHAHHEAGAERLDVDVARAQLDRLFQQIVDGADDRRAAGEIAQAVDVVVGPGRRRLRRLGRRHVLVAEALVQRGRDILERGDLDRRPEPPSTISAARRHAVSVGSPTARHNCRAGLIRKDHHLAQKARREMLDQGGGRQQLRQAHARQAVEARHLVGEIVGRELGRLPEFSQRALAVAQIEPRPRSDIVSRVAPARQIVCEFYRAIGGHQHVSVSRLCLSPVPRVHSVVWSAWLDVKSPRRAVRSGPDMSRSQNRVPAPTSALSPYRCGRLAHSGACAVRCCTAG